MLTSITYLVYLTLSIFITVFVARTLSRNGLPFLIRGFKGNEDIAVSTNHLLVVGFYLLNLGFVLLRMRTGDPYVRAAHRVRDVERRRDPGHSRHISLLQHVRDPSPGPKRARARQAAAGVQDRMTRS